ncbi:MAG: addiction module antidote protein, HigA family [Candidatus Melainabacteria bacterium GWF2_37_15]|nr:MAG: addiction module antidote protein, HigA family [Candidatus Melainabacteria bacterium GWF2_37_15]
MMHNPPHPGEVLKELYFEPLRLTITQASRGLKVTRKALYDLMNGKSGISPHMALKLAKAFKTTPELWLNMQFKYDLWQAKQQYVVDDVQVLYG